jgi:hypothetical protein
MRILGLAVLFCVVTAKGYAASRALILKDDAAPAKPAKAVPAKAAR